MKIIEIVRAHLVAGGYDGLVCDGTCSCELADLQPCGESMSECEPAYRGRNIDDWCSPEDWAMYASKEAAQKSLAAAELIDPQSDTQGQEGR